MFRKAISIALILGAAVGSMSACSKKAEKVMEIGDVSVESGTVSGDGVNFVALNDHISEDLFRYYYKYFKDSFLAEALQYEMMGEDITGNPDISVGDTEAFWNCEIGKDQDGNSVTFASDLYEYTFNRLKRIFALEAIADEYGYKLPENYEKGLNDAIANDIVTNGAKYLEGVTEITDKDGKLYGWVKNRWEMSLAADGITAEEWERLFYTPDIIANGIVQQFKDADILKPRSDSELAEEIRQMLQQELDSFLKTNSKIKIITYFLKMETSSDNTSTDASNDNSVADSSEDGSGTEELSPKEFNEQLKLKCEEIYNGLKDGSLSFDDEIKKCDTAEEASKLPTGFVLSHDEAKYYFGESLEGLQVGDFKMITVEGAIYIIQIQELTKDDFGKTTEPTEDDMAAQRNSSIYDAMNALLVKYEEAIEVKSDYLEKYKEPWKIN